MNLRELSDILIRLYPTRQSMEFRSGPGLGKSSVAWQTVRRLSRIHGGTWAFVPQFLSTIEQPDVRGYTLPHKEEDGSLVSTYTLSPIMPHDQMFRVLDGKTVRVFSEGEEVFDYKGVPESGVVFLDEFPQAENDVKKPAAEFLLNRSIGTYSLPDGWVVWAAGNRMEDKSGVIKDMAFIQNRRALFHVEPNANVWVEWASMNGVHPLTIAFARKFPGLVFADAVPDKDGPFCTPRSLVFMSQGLEALRPEGMRETELPLTGISPEYAASWIGEGAAAQYVAFCRVAEELPDIEDVIDHPTTAPCPSEDKPDAQLVMGNLVAHYMTEDNAGALMTYMFRLMREIQVVVVRMAMQRDPALLNNKKFGEWVSQHHELIIKALS